jgi:hypothetical protein
MSLDKFPTRIIGLDSTFERFGNTYVEIPNGNGGFLDALKTFLITLVVIVVFLIGGYHLIKWNNSYNIESLNNIDFKNNTAQFYNVLEENKDKYKIIGIYPYKNGGSGYILTEKKCYEYSKNLVIGYSTYYSSEELKRMDYVDKSKIIEFK